MSYRNGSSSVSTGIGGGITLNWGSINYANVVAQRWLFPWGDTAPSTIAHHIVAPFAIRIFTLEMYETSQIASAVETNSQLRRALDTINVGPTLTKVAAAVTIRVQLSPPIDIVEGETLAVRWDQEALGAGSFGPQFMMWGVRIG